MKKVIRLTEADLTRIVKRVIEESKYGSFDDEEWYDDNDSRFNNSEFDNMEFDDEEFDEFDDFQSKHGDDTKWFGKGESGRKMFDTYKDKHKKPFKVRTRRGMDEQNIGGPDAQLASKLRSQTNKSNNVVCGKFVNYSPVTQSNKSRLGVTDEKVLELSAIYLEPHSGGKLEGKNLSGQKVWLNSKGFSDWQSGDSKLAITAAKELYSGISGLDISGQGAKKINNVAQMWRSFDIFTQNEFLKEWYRISQNTETPWEAIEGDNEGNLSKIMIKDSTNKVQKYCPTKSISY